MQKYLIKILLICLISLTQCRPTSDTNFDTSKFPLFDKNDLQTFQISGSKDNIIEGENGTFIVIPKGAFLTKSGKPKKGDIDIQLIEAFTVEQLLALNLSTESDGKPLETNGAFYLEATSNGEKLTINPDNPIYIELPESKKLPNLKIYEGIRDDDGNINWINPKEIKKYLTTVDLSLLDFYPKNYEITVENGMPRNGYEVATTEVKDSFYYSLATRKPNSIGKLIPTDYNEGFSNPNSKVQDGKYTDDSYEVKPMQMPEEGEESEGDSTCTYGVNPAIIKIIKTDNFQNTFIATKAFEQRLKTIFKVCKDGILELYIKNLDKNLWEVDAMAAEKLESGFYQKIFKQYAAEKLTNIRNPTKNQEKLNKYYEQQLTKTMRELEQTQSKLNRQLAKANKIAEREAKQYKKLLWKREKYRMTRFGFEWSKTGWTMAGKPWEEVVEKEGKELTFTIKGVEQCDRVYAYLTYPNIKSILKININAPTRFITKKAEKMEFIGIGYNEDNPFMGIQPFIYDDTEYIEVTLEPQTKKGFGRILKQYEKSGRVNSIATDLEYQEFLYQEKLRQQRLREDRIFLRKLEEKAFPCCRPVIQTDSTLTG